MKTPKQNDPARNAWREECRAWWDAMATLDAAAAGDARAKWRMVWSLARYEARQGRPPVAIDAWLTAARDALDARRDGVDASRPGARGRLLAGGWRPLHPPVLP